MKRFDLMDDIMENPMTVILQEKNKDRDEMIKMAKQIVKLENKIARMRSGFKREFAKLKEEHLEERNRLLEENDRVNEERTKTELKLEKQLVSLDIQNTYLKEDLETVLAILKRGGGLKEVENIIRRNSDE